MGDPSGYDVIGDVHGHADKLVGLLQALGYRMAEDSWRHENRQAVFVGDLIDRGPTQRQTVDIARRMVAAGSALIVMGNHEFNAIAWATPDPDLDGEYLRRRRGTGGDRHRRQHHAFLREVGEDSQLHAHYIAWFRSLPMWLDLDGLRVVHACWDAQAMATIESFNGGSAHLTDALLIASSRKDTSAYWAVENLLKGPEVDLPVGCSYVDKDGHLRRRARLRWWDGEAATLRSAAEIPPGAAAVDGSPLPELPDTSLAPDALPAYRDSVPVLFGHYWRKGNQHIDTPVSACVDYSAGAGGPLVAYRWTVGERELDASNFVSYPPAPRSVG